jgi:luciferase family oxidoreductase group 1
LGLPFGFASHFAPEYLRVALELYRHHFKPSQQLQKPYVIVGIGAYCADTDDEARHLFTSAQQQILTLIRGRPGKLPPPVESMDGLWNDAERTALAQRARYTVIGSPVSVAGRIKEIAAETNCDELIVVSQIYEPSARLRSFELVSEIFKDLGGK